MNHLFDLPDPKPAAKQSKAKPADITINRVNREIAKRRYYLHKQLDDKFTLTAATRKIKTEYTSFTAIPVGQRYYIGQLIQLGYEIQYELFK